MKKAKRLTALLLAAALLATCVVQGFAGDGAPYTETISGRIADSGGVSPVHTGEYSVTFSYDSSCGKVQAAGGSSCDPGDTVTFTVTPEAEYYAAQVISTPEELSWTEGGAGETYGSLDPGEVLEYSFVMPESDVEVWVEFGIVGAEDADDLEAGNASFRGYADWIAEQLEETGTDSGGAMESSADSMGVAESSAEGAVAAGADASAEVQAALLLESFAEKAGIAVRAEAAQQTMSVKLTYTQSIKYMTWSTHDYQLADGTAAFCAEPSNQTPSPGTYTASRYSNDLMRAVLYYGYGGPGENSQYGVTCYLSQNGGDSTMSYIWTHLLTSYVYDGCSDDSDAFRGVNDGTKQGVKNLIAQYNNILWMVPSGFVAYTFSTGSSYQTMVFGHDDPSGAAAVQKVSADTSVSGAGSVYTLAGAVYGIYSDSGCTQLAASMTTDENGYASAEVNEGSYYIKEISASTGYDLDTTGGPYGNGVYPVTVTAGGTGTVSSAEPPKTMCLDIHKGSSLPAVSGGNSNYSLSGAVYGVYTDETCTNCLTQLTTDENGQASAGGLPLGVYWVKEITAPPGFEMDSTVHRIDASNTSVASGTHYGVYSYDTPVYGLICVRKVSAVPELTDGNELYSVKNAVFYVYTSEADMQAERNLCAVITTGEDGSGTSGMLPIGTYYVKEASDGSSRGYWVDETEYGPYSITADTAPGTVINVDNPAGYSTDPAVYEPPVYGYIEIYKESAKPSVTDENSSYSLLNAQYGVYNENGDLVDTIVISQYTADGCGYGKSGMIPVGTYTVKEIKASQGYNQDEEAKEVEIKDGAASAVTYSVTSREDPWEISLSIQKTMNLDSLTFTPTRGYDISVLEALIRSSTDYSLQGAVYGIYSTLADAKADTNGTRAITTVMTDENGGATASSLPMNTYYVKELEAPMGFEADTTGGPYGNGIYVVDAVYGTVTSDQQIVALEIMEDITGGGIEIYKKSVDQLTTETYPEYYSLAGAVYTVYYDEGCNIVAGTITTDEDGYGSLDGLILGYTYYVKETQAPTATLESGEEVAMYQLDETVYAVKGGDDEESVPSLVSWEEPVYRTIYIHKGPLQMLETGRAFDAHIPAEATNVVFTNGRTIPAGAVDVSYAQNNGILAWLEGDTWYVQAADGGTIFFNYDSSYMFREQGYSSTDENRYGHRIVSVDFGEGIIDTSYTTDMSCMFYHCIGLTTLTGLSEFDTSGVTDMSCMFTCASSITEIDLSGWDTSAVTVMNDMFAHCRDLENIIVDEGFNTSGVTDFHDMFAYTNLPNSKYQYMVNNIEINTDIVTSVSEMFIEGKSELSQYESGYTLTSLDLASWNLGNVSVSLNMGGLFDYCENLTTVNGLAIPATVSSVAYMFQFCHNLGGGVSPMTISFYSGSSTLGYTDMFNECSDYLDNTYGYFNESVVLNCTNSTQGAIAKKCVATAPDGVKNTIIVVKVNGTVETASLDAYAVSAGAGLANLALFTGSTAGIASDSYAEAVDAEIAILASILSSRIGDMAETSDVASGIGILSPAEASAEKAGLMSVAERFAEKAGLISVVQAETDETAYPNLCDAVYTAFSDSGFTEPWGIFEFQRLNEDENTGAQTAIYMLDHIPYGMTLYVKETQPSSGYELDETEWVFGPEDRSGMYVTSYEPFGGDEAWISLVKSIDTDTDLSGLPDYSMEGIQYGLYTSSSCADSSLIHTFTLNENGIDPDGSYGPIDTGSWEEGASQTYYIREIESSVPAGLKADTAVHEIKITKGADTSETVRVKDEPVLGNIAVQKQSDVSLTALNQYGGSYSYEGMQVSIYTDADCTDLYGILETDSDGYAEISGLPVGTYYLKETYAPSGFEADSTVYRAVLEADSEKTAVTTAYYHADSAETLSAEVLILTDEPETGSILIYKSAEDGSPADASELSVEGATFGIYGTENDADHDRNAIGYMTTDETGCAEYAGLYYGTYYIRETVGTEDLDVLDETIAAVLSAARSGYSVYAEDPVRKGELQIEKSSSDPELTDGSEWYTFAGIRYGVYTDESCEREYLAGMVDLAADGTGSLGGLSATAVYYVKEYRTNDCYELSDVVYAVDMTLGTTGAGDAENTVRFTLMTEDAPKTGGSLRLKKTGTETNLTYGSSLYSLTGAVYGLYGTEADAETDPDGSGAIAVLTTDENGYTEYCDLTDYGFGMYYVKELAASPGYLLDTEIREVEVSPGTMSTEGDDSRITVKMDEIPAYTTTGLTLYKEPAFDLTEYSFEGTQFTIRYYADHYDSVEEIGEQAADALWIIEVKENDDGTWSASLDRDHCVGGMTDTLFYDSEGNAALPLGTLVIEETAAADGYTTDGLLRDASGTALSGENGQYLLQILQEDSGTAAVLSGGGEAISYIFTKEDAPDASITLNKVDDDGTALGNVTFSLYVYDEERQDYIYVDSRTTNGEGMAYWEHLSFGTYRITETSTQDGRSLLAEAIEVTLPYEMTAGEVKQGNVDVSKAYTSADGGTYYFVDLIYTVTNSGTFSFPKAGGSAWPAAGAVGLAALAAGVLLALRRRKYVRQ